MKKITIKELLYKSEEVRKFCEENNLTEQEMILNMAPLFTYKEGLDECKNCNGKVCNASVKEMYPTITLDLNRHVEVKYNECPKVKAFHPGNFEVISYTDNDIDIQVTSARKELLKVLNEFYDNYFSSNKQFVKGIYLYGECGVGKSLIVYQFAKNLVSKGAKVIFAYYPDLVRELQNSFGTVKLEKLIIKLKTVDILILDDIAREANTAYIRDQILGPILQYRCDNNLPMFVTSNRNFDLLEKHLSETNNLIDTVKGKALIARFKYLMKEYELKDRDFRSEKF